MTEEWVRKMWYPYTTEYHSAIKKSEILPFAARWMKLVDNSLSEISQTEKDKYYMKSLTGGMENKRYK